jgi:hypothetical protein
LINEYKRMHLSVFPNLWYITHNRKYYALIITGIYTLERDAYIFTLHS